MVGFETKLDEIGRRSHSKTNCEDHIESINSDRLVGICNIHKMNQVNLRRIWLGYRMGVGLWLKFPLPLGLTYFFTYMGSEKINNSF